ncbi:MAG: endo-1,4-beta-xylanase [Planctomycetota bacterium]
MAPVAGHEHARARLIWTGLQKFRIQDRDEVWAAAQRDPEVLRHRIDGHFVDILTQTAGLIDHWDVVNEPYTQHEMLDLLGRDEMVHWFELARKHAPDAGLFLNDFGILASSGVDFEKQQFMLDTARFLRDRGAPITAIGFQAHMGQGLTPPTRVLGILDRFAELDLPIMITEYDVTVPDAQTQERYTRDFMAAVFSHPSVNGFTTWGFWEPVMWAGRSAMYDRDWNLMPVGRAYRGLVLGEWLTHASGHTDATGRLTVRGFHGDYTIQIDPGRDQPSQLVAVTLPPEGTQVSVDLAADRLRVEIRSND